MKDTTPHGIMEEALSLIAASPHLAGSALAHIAAGALPAPCQQGPMVAPASIVAKMRCHNIMVELSADGSRTETPMLHAVHADDGPNKTWAKYTPSGDLRIQINNPSALGIIGPGKHYLVTIEECDASA